MARTEPFDTHSSEYEAWFEDNHFAYLSELEAVKAQLPGKGKGLEIGVGTGRFAAPLGINIGVEPSGNMREIALKRGIQVFEGTGENLPFDNTQFDIVLMVTTICFLDDVKAAFDEAYRVLNSGGHFLVGFVDRDSPIGKQYEKHKDESAFYRDATFYSASEVERLLVETGFRHVTFVQTIFSELSQISGIEPVKPGYGGGSFLVARGRK